MTAPWAYPFDPRTLYVDLPMATVVPVPKVDAGAAPAIWTLLSPMGLAKRPGPLAVPHAKTGTRTPLGFLSNRKPNAAALQRLVADRVAQAMPAVELRFYEKANSSLGAGEPLLNTIAAECGLVVNGTGD